METAVSATRERRKRVHSTKCPCCSHDKGKPELPSRQSRKRKGDEIKSDGTSVLKTRRKSKSVKEKKSTTSQLTPSKKSNSDFKEDKSTEGRVLRSGRSTPVCIEAVCEKEKPVSKRKAKQVKLVKQEKVADNDESKSGSTGVKPEAVSDISNEKNVPGTSSKSKAKPRKIQNKVSKYRTKSFAKSRLGNTSVQQKRGKVGKPKGTSKSSAPKTQTTSSTGKVIKNRHSKLAKLSSNIAPVSSGPAKTSAIEKLKLRAFDQLKEKLEIAFDRSSISVPECVQLLQQITSPNLSEIFYCQPSSVDEGSASESLVEGLVGKSLPEIMKEGMSRGEISMNVEEKIDKKENAVVAENLSKAAEALVSFKNQATSTNSRIDVHQGASAENLANSNAQITQVIKRDNLGFQNVDKPTNACCSSEGLPGSNQKFVTTRMGGMAIPEQAKTESNPPNTTPFQQKTFQPNVGMQSTSNQETQSGNLPSVCDLVGNGYQLVVTSITPSSMSILSSSNPLIPTTNRLLPIANPLIPTTNQLVQTNPLIPTAIHTLHPNPLTPTSGQLFPTANPLLSTTNPLLSSFPDVSHLATAASKTNTPVVGVHSPGAPLVQAQNVLMSQAQMTFPLLQAPSQGMGAPIPSVMTCPNPQPNPRPRCPNPGTLPQPTTSTTTQQPTTLLTASLNQRLFLPQVTPPIDQKTLGSNLPKLLPAIKQPHDLILSKTAGTLATTGTMETPASGKLRPILPREPLLPPFARFNRAQESLPNPGKASDISSNVKQVVKRFVSGRAKNFDNASSQQTSLPDIASTFNKATFTANSQGKVESMFAPAQNTQEYSEMVNKEQAIKALLSIGNGQQLVQQEVKGASNVAASSKVTETKNKGDLLVVFDTDKGIFKVDDVTIDPTVNTIGKESYTCGKCGKIFTSLSYLARHIKRVCPDMTQRKWKCTHCDKAFRHPFGLQQHVFTHTGERPHKCPQCPKAFYSSNDLRRHSRIHSGERPYNCTHCGKTFATTISLKTHTFIHTGEKPHRCPHCPKTFATSSKLGRHIVTHSEQRPFACSYCPKTFNRSGDLRRHNLNLHEGKLKESVGDVEDKESKKVVEVPKDLISSIIDEHQTKIEVQANQQNQIKN